MNIKQKYSSIKQINSQNQRNFIYKINLQLIMHFSFNSSTDIHSMEIFHKKSSLEKEKNLKRKEV